MKLTFSIFCFTTVFFGVKCGLINNLMGTITEKLDEVTDGNIIKNMENIVYNDTKDIVVDLSDLLHLRENKNNEKKDRSENKKDVQREEVSNAVTSTTIQASTATMTNTSIQPNKMNTLDINAKPAIEKTVGREEGDVNGNQEETTLSEDSSESSKLVFIEKGHHHGGGEILPQIAQHNQKDKVTKDGLTQQETTNINTSNEVIVMYENSQLTNFNNLSHDRNTDVTYRNDGVDVVINKDCPEGQEMIFDGSCIDIDIATEYQFVKDVPKSLFLGGCRIGFATADDGSCQEVLYD